jgi:hypothetical protein
VIEKVMTQDASLTFPKQFVNWMESQGWGGFADALMTMASQTNVQTLPRNVRILRQIATLRDTGKERTELCNRLASSIIQAIEKFDKEVLDSWSCPRWDRTEIVIDMVNALASIGDNGLLNRFLTWQSDHSRYELIEVQIPAVEKLVPLLKQASVKNRALKDWIKGLRRELEALTKSKPKQPSNWKRESDLSCSCADCKRLSVFLADPTQPEARFPLAKARRQHLHGIIDRHECDCTHTTLRVGSPQVLVCKKTNASFLKACKVYEQDLKHLSFIKEIDS